MLSQEARMGIQWTCQYAADDAARPMTAMTVAVGNALPYLRKRLPSPRAASSAQPHAARRLVRESRRAVSSFTTAASSAER